jgi:hypothetical protein
VEMCIEVPMMHVLCCCGVGMRCTSQCYLECTCTYVASGTKFGFCVRYSTRIGGHQVDLSGMMRICDVASRMVRLLVVRLWLIVQQVPLGLAVRFPI